MLSAATQSGSSVQEREGEMSADTMMKYSLSEIDDLIAKGDDKTDFNFLKTHEPDEALPEEFWSKAVMTGPKITTKSVHLRLQPEVFEFFIKQTGGKGHIAKMQAVLKAYADAHS
jgi:uncharacterized protein (DUF4415 family)